MSASITTTTSTTSTVSSESAFDATPSHQLPEATCTTSAPAAADALVQEYLIGVTINKAAYTGRPNEDTFATVEVEGVSGGRKQTAIATRSEQPVYNEYFVFEMRQRLPAMLQRGLRVAAWRRTCCPARRDECIGEIWIELNTVWQMPNHGFIRKWAQLVPAANTKQLNVTHYIQLNVSIIAKGQPPGPSLLSARDYDIIEENLLTNTTAPQAPRNVIYCVNIFSAMFEKKRDHCISVKFAGTTLKTRIKSKSLYPQWNEKLMFPGSYPSLGQSFHIDIMFCILPVASAQITFDDMLLPTTMMANRQVEQSPSFGPAYVEMRNVLTGAHFGRILMSIRTEEGSSSEVIQYRPALSMDIPQFVEYEYWTMGAMTARCTLYDTTFAADVKLSKVSTRLRWAANVSRLVPYQLYKGDQSTTTGVPAVFEPMDVSLSVPDLRFKWLVDNRLDRLSVQFQDRLFELSQIQQLQLNQLHSVLRRITEEIKDELSEIRAFIAAVRTRKYTEWDETRRKCLIAQMDEYIITVKTCHSIVSDRTFNAAAEIADVRLLLQDGLAALRQFIRRYRQNRWPDVHIEFVSASGKVLATHSCDAARYLVGTPTPLDANEDDATEGACRPPNRQDNGLMCNEPHTVVFKPAACTHGDCLRCGCFFAAVQLRMSIDVAKGHCEPADLQVLSTALSTTYANVKVYAHQVKLHSDAIAYEETDGLVLEAILAGDSIAATQPLSRRPNGEQRLPIWNETLRIDRPLRQCCEASRALLNVPIMVLELKRRQPKKKSVASTCLGRTFFVPALRADNLDEAHTNVQSPLRWIDCMFDGVRRAEILISAEIAYGASLQRADGGGDEMIPIPPAICPAMTKYKVEVTFVGLRHWKKCPHKTLGRYLIDFVFGELQLRSGLSSKPFGCSMNLIDPFKSGYVTLPEDPAFWPAISLRHVDCSSRHERVIGAAQHTQAGNYFMRKAARAKATWESIALQMPDDLAHGDDNERQALLDDGDPAESNAARKPHRTRSKRFASLLKHHIKRAKTAASKQSVDRGSANTPRPKYQTLAGGSQVGLTWWTKYYNSVRQPDGDGDMFGGTTHKHRLTVYDTELELCEEFGYLRDWSDCVDMVVVGHGDKPLEKKHQKAGKGGPTTVRSYAQLKIDVKVRKCDNSFDCFSLNKAQQLLDLISERPVLLNVYVVQGINLRPRDRVESSDAYIRIECGATKINDRLNYVPNQANPIFGKRYQVTAVLPKNIAIKISVYDRDAICDDHIGSTIIDVEDRLRSRHRAYSGLPLEYNRLGYNVWRSNQPPSTILRQMCEQVAIDPPLLIGNKMLVGGMTFHDRSTALSADEPLFERLCLSVLNELESIPAFGYKLVPEHVETRSLFRDDRPGLEQGKLQMWLEIADPTRPPTLVDIAPTEPQKFELRVIVWGTADVKLDDTNVFGKKMSDIYVKGWLDDADATQRTDVHFRSLTGEAKFNWRMVFPLLYAEAEEMLVVVKRKRFFEQYDTMLKRPVMLTVQVWDNDAMSKDDFLGSASILITDFPMPVRKEADCKLLTAAQLKHKSVERVNLFQRQHSVRGWFPVKGMLQNGKIGQTGKVELDLEVMCSSMATPVGLGREGPFALPDPVRPETSFSWYSNPLRSMKHIVMPCLKKVCIWLVVIVVIGVAVYIAVDVAKKALEANASSSSSFGRVVGHNK